MSGMDSLSLRLLWVERSHSRVAAPPAMRWSEPITYPCWVLDHCSFAGLHVRVAAAGAPPGAFPRAVDTWHLYAPETPYHEAAERPNQIVEKRWVLFGWQDPPPALRAAGFAAFSDEQRVLAPLLDAIHELTDAGGDGGGGRIAANGLLQAMLGHLLRAIEAGDPPPARLTIARPGQRSARPELAERVDAVIARRMRRPPTLAEIARELGMSESSLSHRFKRATGQSVMERSRALRIEAARTLLLRDGSSVKAIACQLGFSSAFHLSRVFTAVCGLPPAEWRRRHGGT